MLSLLRHRPGSTAAALRAARAIYVLPLSLHQGIKQLPPRPKVDESEIVESFLKGSGPGGQKINKTSSAVQLKHLPTGIVVKSQATRSRDQNRKIARTNLAEKLEAMTLGSESRVAVKAEVKRKKKASGDKKRKRKYRRLEEEKDGLTDGAVTGKDSAAGQEGREIGESVPDQEEALPGG
ncbi:MAG: hypothetical protein M1817_006613 [Caeruleum heppii]|nr:MAG: hypothetical protein M1817_006613 [Caeruleum heppii]